MNKPDLYLLELEDACFVNIRDRLRETGFELTIITGFGNGHLRAVTPDPHAALALIPAALGLERIREELSRLRSLRIAAVLLEEDSGTDGITEEDLPVSGHLPVSLSPALFRRSLAAILRMHSAALSGGSSRSRPTSLTETQRDLHHRILDLINRKQEAIPLLSEILEHLREHTNTESAAVRIHSGGDFPYLASLGYDNDFLTKENSLLPRDDRRCRVQNGRFDCLCGAVIEGRIPAGNPYFTSKGSLHCPDTERILADNERDPFLPPMRNTCLHAGYRTLVLIPIRSGGESLGLLQLADRRPDRIAPETVTFLEGIATTIAIAVRQLLDMEALAASEQKFRTITEQIQELIALTDREGRITYASPAAKDLFGLSPESMTGRPFTDFLAAESIPVALTVFRESLASGEGVTDLDLRMKRADGSLFHGLLSALIRGDGTLVTIRDITELKETESLLRQAFDDNKQLLRELQHRAKNSFTTIHSLLEYRANSADSPDISRVLKDIGIRVMALSRLYSRLYHTGSPDRIRLDEYCDEVIRDAASGGSGISIATDCEPVTSTARIASTIGLILTEAVTNSCKYAFPENRRGTIFLELKALPYGFRLIIGDDGTGFDPERIDGKSFGLQLIRGMVRQIHAKMELDTDNGTRYAITVGR